MRKRHSILLAVLLTPAIIGLGAEQAAVRFFCLSLQFQSVSQTFGLQSLSFTTLSPNATPNGELRPLFTPGAPSHGSYFLLKDPNLGTIQGPIEFDVPPVPDTTGDGFSDFFKTTQSVPSTTTSGAYQSDDGLFSGKVSAVWNRPAGSAAGTCMVTMTDDTFGRLQPYNMPFALIEYQGSMNYTVAATNVDATITLAQLPDQVNSLSGALEFFRSPTNSTDQIFLQPGVWTNNQGQSLVYTNALIHRDLVVSTNYFGTMFFFDGNPSTPDPDYFYWEISIKDPNDTNANGIPDLTDAVSQTLVAPVLSLASTTAGLTLMLNAPLGQKVTIQSAARLPATAWATGITVTLTNNPQAISLPLPVANQFWRAVSSY